MTLTSFGGALSAELNEGLTNRRPFNSIGEGHKPSSNATSVDLTTEDIIHNRWLVKIVNRRLCNLT
ncbi:MAG: hypothetical protein ACTS41_01305 [Candidatus Hodgkinia cicadicola]